MTMIEKVARSLCSLHYEKRFDAKATDKIVVINVDGNWHLFRKEAIRAIEAMRSPTEAMVINIRPSLLPIDVWHAMIDAALKETA